MLWLILGAFVLADQVVTEIELNRANLERLAPWLRGKTMIVRNGLDTARFVPNVARGARTHDEPFRFCVVATLSVVKNPLRVVAAVAELRRRGHERFRVDWYGRDGLPERVNLGGIARAQAATLGLHDHLVFHGDAPCIERAYRRSDALLHASVAEGFPNAVSEAMACGLPIAVSRVSDLPQVVAEAQNGIVFDETDPTSMADAMEHMMTLPHDELAAMGSRSRALAVHWFGSERYIAEYEDLYWQMTLKRSPAAECA